MKKRNQEILRLRLRYEVAQLAKSLNIGEIPVLQSVSNFEKILDSDDLLARFIWQADDYLDTLQSSLLKDLRKEVETVVGLDEETDAHRPAFPLSLNIPGLLIQAKSSHALLNLLISDSWKALIQKEEKLSQSLELILDAQISGGSKNANNLVSKIALLNEARSSTQRCWEYLLVIHSASSDQLILDGEPIKKASLPPLSKSRRSIARSPMVEEFLAGVKKLRMSDAYPEDLATVTGYSAATWSRYLKDATFLASLMRAVERQTHYRGSKKVETKQFWNAVYQGLFNWVDKARVRVASRPLRRSAKIDADSIEGSDDFKAEVEEKSRYARKTVVPKDDDQ